MKLHTTNYINTFIEVSDDCPTTVAEIPPQKGEAKSVANLQFDLVKRNPYKFTSDDVFFQGFCRAKRPHRKRVPSSTREVFLERATVF